MSASRASIGPIYAGEDSAADVSGASKALLDAVPLPLLLCDAEVSPVHWNGAFGVLADVSVEGADYPGATCPGTVDRERIATTLPMLRFAGEAVLGNAPVPCEVTLSDPVAGARVFEIDGRRWPRDGGLADGVLFTFRDVTARRTAIAQLQYSREEIVQFKYHVSHDLGAPITSARSLLGLIEDELSDGRIGEAPEMIEETRAQLTRLESLISDLMSLARAGAEMLEPVEVDLRELMDEIVASDSLHSRELEVSVTLVFDQPTLCTDRTRLRQILANLISNARKFRDVEEPAPFVNVEVSDDGEHWRVAVSDNGVGMTAEVAARAFDMFARGSGQHPGHGLGLHIVLKHVDHLGGAVSVGRLAKPTVIDIRLPKVPVDDAAAG